jgi:hypothetical protein
VWTDYDRLLGRMLYAGERKGWIMTSVLDYITCPQCGNEFAYSSWKVAECVAI